MSDETQHVRVRERLGNHRNNQERNTVSGHICNECGAHTKTPERIDLTLRSGDQISLVVCPSCRCIRSSLESCCEHTGCKLAATGWMADSEGNYHQTCHLHQPGAK